MLYPHNTGMRTTAQQEQKFGEATGLATILQTSVDWIADNLDAETVFGHDALVEYARQMAPQDIYSEDVLIDWALTHGFMKEVD